MSPAQERAARARASLARARADGIAGKCPACHGTYEAGETRGKPCGLCFDLGPWQEYLRAFSDLTWARDEDSEQEARLIMDDCLAIRLRGAARSRWVKDGIGPIPA